MRPVEYYRNMSARLAVLLTAVVVLGVIVGGITAYMIIKRELGQRHFSIIENDLRYFAELYRKDGRDEFVDALKSHMRSSRDHETIFYLTDATGNTLVSNINPSLQLPDKAEMASAALGLEEDFSYFLVSAPMGTMRLTLGQSAEDVSEIEEIFLQAGGWALLLIIALTLSGVFAIATRTNQRISELGNALDAVNAGKLDTRLPVSRRNDEIDRVVTLMNRSIAALGNVVETNRQISSDIAHDLKTPLNRLHIDIEMAIAREARGEKVTEELERIEAESGRILSTFDALLRIAQIEAGARKERFVSLDLGAATSNVAEFYQSYAEDLGAALVIDVPDHPALINGDSELLTQLISNLIENALKHAGGRPSVAVVVHDLGDRLLLDVKDNGPGIPAGERENVLRRLYRLEKSRSTPGSGLGLAMVKAIADLHEATIKLADAQPGLVVQIAFPARSG